MAREHRLSEVQEADIVDLAHDGRGIARVDGKTVFIDGALPGERVRLRIIKRRRQFDEAGLVEVLSASPDRVAPACAHFMMRSQIPLRTLASGLRATRFASANAGTIFGALPPLVMM